MEAQGRLSRADEFMDLPEALITRILCHSAPKDISSTSKTCKYLNKLINSPEFQKVYQVSRHKRGCIITDNYGSECPEPLLYIYDIISLQWSTIAVAKLCPSMLNPKMVSASGGLILFLANKRRSCDDGRGLSEQRKELVVVQLFTKGTIILPDPPSPVVLSSEIANNCLIEIVVDDMGSSYKVILFAPILMKEVFWVYDSCTPAWKQVTLSDTGFPLRGLNRIVSRRSVLYRGVLYWLIVGLTGASYLIFYDTQCDALRRPILCFSRAETSSLCGIAVCGGKVIRVSKYSRGESGLSVSQLNEENCDDWEPLFESSVPNIGCDVFCETGLGMAVCSSAEEENMFWMLCLVSKEKEIYGHKMLGRHMWLFACNRRDGNWQQLSPCTTGECDDKYHSGVTNGIFHRPLSQAKWMNFKFSGPIGPI
ncbi:hypothetical protein SUGI_0278040 [Cryptomeria japonica]|uniref:uncharacterized protein LOC131029894 n=1 Tax=Cryptomeria japonica TaxID=3369 RepID=UPI0024089D40|nr:uncharacterized protein LOC131029894 [Cryptomeria japonica]GLJ16390.1 hypothetical protein SUGI_0278040 [Cryptomeria japonica]